MLIKKHQDKLYAVHPGADPAAIPESGCCEVSQAYAELLGSQYVKDYDGEFDSIKYSENFYGDLYGKLEEGLSPSEALESMGLSPEIMGPMRVSNVVAKAKEKGNLSKARKEFDEGTGDLARVLEAYRSNRYVRLISGSRIYYTEDFFRDMMDLLDKGKSPTDAYRELGFDPGLLGTQRAYKAAQHAREWKDKQKEPQYKVGDFAGNVPLSEMMKEWGTPEADSRWNAYLMGRVIYLETVQKELKKKDLEALGVTYQVEIKDPEQKLDMIKTVHQFITQEGETYGLKRSECLKIFGVKSSTYSGQLKRLKNLEETAEIRKEAEELKKKEDEEIQREILDIVIRKNGYVPGRRCLQLWLLAYHKRYLSEKRCAAFLKRMHLSPTTKDGKLINNPYQGMDTHFHQCAAPRNLVAGCFYMGFRKVILCDITYIIYDNGTKVAYHIEFYDPFMDETLGWATMDTMSVELVKEAYKMMMAEHGEEIRSNPVFYLHSDQGSQLLEISFSELVSKDGFTRSVSRRGTPLDNGPMEAKFSRVKASIRGKVLMCKNLEQVRQFLDGHIVECNEEPKFELGGLNPKEYLQYLRTGVYPLKEYYGVKLEDLNPVIMLINRYKERARKRTEKAKQESEKHGEMVKMMKDTMKTSPITLVALDLQTAVQQQIRMEQNKLSCDQERNLWAIFEKEVRKALEFLKNADKETLEALKDRQNWDNYPELAYVKAFGEKAKGVPQVNKKALSDALKDKAELWDRMESLIRISTDFVCDADDDLRKELQDRDNWSKYPELAILDVYSQIQTEAVG